MNENLAAKEEVSKPFIGNSVKVSIQNDERRKRNIRLIFIILLLLGVSIALIGVKQIFLNKTSSEKGSILSNSSQPNEIIKIYIFNYTNVDEFVAGIDKKLHLDEIGPFTFAETTEKIILSSDESSETFQFNRKYVFLPDQSTIVSLNATIVLPNYLLMGVLANLQKLVPFLRFGVNAALSMVKPEEIDIIPVNDVLNGHESALIKAISAVKWDVSAKDTGTLTHIGKLREYALTVSKDERRVGMIEKVGESERMNMWKSEKCNRINVSDGIAFDREEVKTKQKLYSYSSELCRSLPFEFVKESRAGVTSTYYYEIPESVFSSDSDDYCELKSFGEPHINGVLSVSDCVREKPPLYMTQPHFLGGDASLFEYFDGLKPDRNLHKSFAHIDPRTSTIVQGRIRLQNNMKLYRSKNYFTSFPDKVLFPTVWFEISS